MPTLDDFLRTGRLGPLLPGVGLDDVRRDLGEPDHYSVRARPVRVLKYGPVQVGFFASSDDPRARLESIRIDLREPPTSLPEPIRFEGWLPAGSGIAEVRRHVGRLGIDAPATATETGDSTLLPLPSGVHLVFSDAGLESLQLFESRAPRFKQVSVQVPEGAWPEILRRAAEAKLSASALCSLWIRERLATEESRPAPVPTSGRREAGAQAHSR